MNNRFSNSTKTASEGAALLCIALCLSYLEAILPIQMLIPLPGFKLGLANIAIIVALYRYSFTLAISVSLCRVILSSMLFGSISSLIFSLFGATLSFISLVITAVFLKRKVSFIGISILSALFHNAGQLLGAVLVMGDTSPLFYCPPLFAASLITGGATGIILFILPKQIFTRRSFSN